MGINRFVKKPTQKSIHQIESEIKTKVNLKQREADSRAKAKSDSQIKNPIRNAMKEGVKTRKNISQKTIPNKDVKTRDAKMQTQEAKAKPQTAKTKDTGGIFKKDIKNPARILAKTVYKPRRAAPQQFPEKTANKQQQQQQAATKPQSGKPNAVKTAKQAANVLAKKAMPPTGKKSGKKNLKTAENNRVKQEAGGEKQKVNDKGKSEGTKSQANADTGQGKTKGEVKHVSSHTSTVGGHLAAKGSKNGENVTKEDGVKKSKDKKSAKAAKQSSPAGEKSETRELNASLGQDDGSQKDPDQQVSVKEYVPVDFDNPDPNRIRLTKAATKLEENLDWVRDLARFNSDHVIKELSNPVTISNWTPEVPLSERVVREFMKETTNVVDFAQLLIKLNSPTNGYNGTSC